MYTETEAKLKLASLDEVAECLACRGASRCSETVQTDYYFDTSDSQLTRSDRCLRLRVEGQADEASFVLTYKGAKEASDFKKRREVNLPVGDRDAAEALLDGLGYQKALVFNKRRHLWRLLDCEVALDELPLIGFFVEIEGPNAEAISRVRQTLNLGDAPHVMDSYASLIADRLAQLGLEQRDVFL